MEGLKNALEFIYDNWTLIITVIGLGFALYTRIQKWRTLSTEEKILLAKEQLKETILNYVIIAEEDYKDNSKYGPIKRAQVINEIYKDYPVLGKIIDQTQLLEWVDELIDDALYTLKDIANKQIDR